MKSFTSDDDAVFFQSPREEVKVEEVKEEAKGFFKILFRGGTARPIQDPGQGITIHATPDVDWISSDTPSLAKEFL